MSCEKRVEGWESICRPHMRERKGSENGGLKGKLWKSKIVWLWLRSAWRGADE
jgi:hypothetical protein